MPVYISPRIVDRIFVKLPSQCMQVVPGEQAVSEVDGLKAEPTLTDWLWQSTSNYRDMALATPFIQGINYGTLDPVSFGVYNLQDAIYCYQVTESLKTVADKSSGDMKIFAEKKFESYDQYTKVLLKEWYIKKPDGVALGEAAKQYADFENTVAKTMDPIYSFIAMIPCSRLWPWLGEQLKKFAGKHGVYEDWVKESFTGDDYKKLESFINSHSTKVDRKAALEVYEKCMKGEYGFFNSVPV